MHDFSSCNLHSTGAIALNNSPFAEGSLPIHVDSLSCRGNETMLLGCPNNNMEVRSCGRFEDASVICQGIQHCVSVVLSKGVLLLSYIGCFAYALFFDILKLHLHINRSLHNIPWKLYNW